MTLRRMVLSDVDAVYGIETASFHTPWSRQSFVDEVTTNVCARYMVAEDNGEILAYAGAWCVLEEGHVTNIAVRPDSRRRGIGEAVTRALMQYCANLGVQYLTLEVRRGNLAAQKLYEKLSFIKLGVRKRYYEDNGEDAFLYVCDHLPFIQEDFEEV